MKRRVRTVEVLVKVYCVACGEVLPTHDAEEFHVGFNPDHEETRSVYEKRRIVVAA